MKVSNRQGLNCHFPIRVFFKKEFGLYVGRVVLVETAVSCLMA